MADMADGHFDGWPLGDIPFLFCVRPETKVVTPMDLSILGISVDLALVSVVYLF